MVVLRRVIPNICEAEVTGQEAGLVLLRIACDDRVFSTSQANISNVYGFMAKSLKQGLGRTREVGVDQKAHERSQPMGSGWWVSCSTSSSA